MLLLLDHLTDPHVALRPTPGLPGRLAYDVHLRDDHHEVRRAYESVVQPHLDELAHEVVVIAERHLLKAHALMASCGAVTATWDPLSFHRSAIQPHPQDAHPQAIDLVIDAARDALTALIQQDLAVVDSTVFRWSTSGIPLLRRLAVHAHGERSDLSADDKIDG